MRTRFVLDYCIETIIALSCVNRALGVARSIVLRRLSDENRAVRTTDCMHATLRGQRMDAMRITSKKRHGGKLSPSLCIARCVRCLASDRPVTRTVGVARNQRLKANNANRIPICALLPAPAETSTAAVRSWISQRPPLPSARDSRTFYPQNTVTTVLPTNSPEPSVNINLTACYP